MAVHTLCRRVFYAGQPFAFDLHEAARSLLFLRFFEALEQFGRNLQRLVVYAPFLAYPKITNLIRQRSFEQRAVS